MITCKIKLEGSFVLRWIAPTARLFSRISTNLCTVNPLFIFDFSLKSIKLFQSSFHSLNNFNIGLIFSSSFQNGLKNMIQLIIILFLAGIGFIFNICNHFNKPSIVMISIVHYYRNKNLIIFANILNQYIFNKIM